VKRALPCLAVLIAACSTALTPVATGEFASPSGLAVASGGDRDLLFIANEGRDNLRALQLCRGPLDGGAPQDSCPAREHLQFLPAPIRVFPATIETANRPRRLASVRLSRLDPTQSPAGVVLAVGADDTLRVVDARNLVEAANHTPLPDGGTVTAMNVLSAHLPFLTADAGVLSSPAADVVAENPLDPNGLEMSAPSGQTVTAFAATLAEGTAPAQLLRFQVGLDANGAATLPTLTGQCTLDPVVPRKLAAIPGGGDRVYIADGAGDGVVSVAKASIPAPSSTPAACTLVRIGAGGRSARSVSVSPAWWDGATPHAAGEFVIMVLEPLTTSTAGNNVDPGGILIARAADSAMVPAPPSSLFDPTDGGVQTDGGFTTGGLPVMQPIAPPFGLPREVTFLRALAPDSTCTPSDGGPPAAPCTPVYVGFPSATPVAEFSLVAAATSTDGATYFIDVLNRRFVNQSYYQGLQTPIFTQGLLLNLSTSDPIPPALTFASACSPSTTPPCPVATDQHPLDGWLTAGVTRSERWRATWHSTFPGLETRSGALSASGSGTIILTFPGLSLAPWQSDPNLQLAAGDTVSFNAYSAPAGAPQSCSDLIASESPSRFELSIVSVPSASTLELSPLAPTALQRGFNLSACPTGLNAVASVRVGGARPWLVYQGTTARGRAANGQAFTATGQRFDYPLDATQPVLASDNVEVAFTISGHDPLVLGTSFSFSLGTGLTPLSFRDSTLPQGLATVVLSYSSPRYPQLVFTSVSGGNALIQADPSQLNNPFTGVTSYK